MLLAALIVKIPAFAAMYYRIEHKKKIICIKIAHDFHFLIY